MDKIQVSVKGNKLPSRIIKKYPNSVGIQPRKPKDPLLKNLPTLVRSWEGKPTYVYKKTFENL